jgi:hypothetical protein
VYLRFIVLHSYILICANFQQAVAHHRRKTANHADASSASNATDPSKQETLLLPETQLNALSARRTSDDLLHLWLLPFPISITPPINFHLTMNHTIIDRERLTLR